MTELERLRRRAARAFGDRSPAEVLDRVRAIVGTSNLPVGFEGDLARDALAKLKDFELGKPTPRELAALEMMLRMMRPAPKFEDGKLEDLSEPEFAAAFPHWTAFQKLLEPIKSSIGRIDAGKQPAGTGFLVNPELVATNRHVLDVISRGTRRLEEGQAEIGFWRELHPPDSEDPVPILDVVAYHEQFDIALLRIKPLARPSLTISGNAPAEEEPVAAIGHPYDDPVNNPLFTRSIFGNRWGVKRVAPGEIVAVNLPFVAHDCSTLGGNSGSPLLSLRTAEVVGLHFGGGFLWRNEAVDCRELAKFIDAHG